MFRIFSQSRRGRTLRWRTAKRVAALIAAVAALCTGTGMALADPPGSIGHSSYPGQYDSRLGNRAIGIMWAANDNGAHGLGPSTLATVRRWALTSGIVRDGLHGMGLHGFYRMDGAINSTLAQANAQCMSRYRAEGGKGTAQCRLFAFGLTHTYAPDWLATSDIRGIGYNDWRPTWYNGPGKWRYSDYPGHWWHTTRKFNGISPDDAAEWEMRKPNRCFIAIVLNQLEPPTGYKLKVTSTASAPSPANDVSASPTHDVFHLASASGTYDNKPITGTVSLHYDGGGYDWNGKPLHSAAQSKNTPVRITHLGDTLSPTYTPAVFHWTRWHAGHYWYAVDIKKQGQLEKGVKTNKNSANETFDIRETTTHIDATTDHDAGNLVTSHSNPVTDTIHVTSSNTIPANIRATVTLHFDGNRNDPAAQGSHQMTIPMKSGDYTSPQFTPKDVVSTWTVWHSGSYYFTVHVDKQGRMENKVDTPNHAERETTVAPDKVWVLDKQGALVNSDHKGTNSVDWNHDSSDGKAVDRETFLPGDPVSAVVSAPIPERQNFSAFEVEDDWHEAERYIAFNHPELVKVYFGDDDSASMQDVTTDFTIRVGGPGVIDAYHTHAVAKPDFLSKINGLTTQKWVKLVITGYFRTDYRTNGRMQILKNGGSETWNNHGKETNVPAVFTWTPHPDKAWIRNTSVFGEEGDPASRNSSGSHKWQVVIDPTDASDPTKRGNVGGDNKLYREGDALGVAINGTIPGKLALKPNIAFNDDYSKSAYFWKPADTSKWKVFEQDATTAEVSSIPDIWDTGRNVTSQFTFSVNGRKLTAQASDAFETSLMHLMNPKQITLVIPGKVVLAQGGGNQQVYHDTGFEEHNTSKGISVVPLNEMGSADRVVTFPDPTDPQGEKAIAGYEVCRNPTSSGSTWEEGEPFENRASQTASGATVDTNRPDVCVWVPNSAKGIVAEAQYGGDQHDGSGDTHNGQGQQVRPGQNVEYRLHILDHGIPADIAAYPVQKVQLVDDLDQNVALNAQTLKIVDNLRSGYTVPKTDYTTKYDAQNHKLTLTFSEDFVRSEWAPGRLVDMDVILEGNISKNLPKDYPSECVSIDNTWRYHVNNGWSASNTLHNRYCNPPRSKEDTQKDPTVNIDGKKVLLGDKVYYRLNLDTTNLAYNEEDPSGSTTKQLYRVQRLGMVDDYDERFLKLDDQKIQVLQFAPGENPKSTRGRDVTGEWNIQDTGGVVYVFAKTVDSIDQTTGRVHYGHSQPKDLKGYWHKKLNRLTDSYINQKLLGYRYQIVLPMKVIRVRNGYTIQNQAIENIDGINYDTNWVYNPPAEINPRKDVVVNVGDASVNGKDIYLHHYFLYRMDSSIRPTQLAYPHVKNWEIVDKLDPSIDRYTGQWAVYASRDLYKGEYLVARKGEKIAGSNFDTKKLRTEGALTYKRLDADAVNNRTQNPDTMLTDGSLFDCTWQADGTLTISANPSYRALASSEEHENGWTAYIQVQRMKPVEHHNNQFHEILNKVDRPSNIVWTRTPSQSPKLEIEKYDVKSGLKLGDRNLPSQALPNAVDGTRIGLLIRNVGKSEIHKLTMSDATIAGNGIVTWDAAGLTLLRNADLKPGQQITIYGTLRGVSRFHTDRATVHGTPILPCPVPSSPAPSIDKPQNGTSVKYCDSTPIQLHDDWNGKRTAVPAWFHIPGVRASGLPQTGVAVTTLLILSLALTGMGIGFGLARRHQAMHA